MSSTYREPFLRGEHDETGILWIPLEDINRMRGKQYTIRDLRRRRLLPGEDFKIVDPREGDDFVRRLWPDADQPLQIVVSEPGMRRLLMRVSGPADRYLQEWAIAESLPVMDPTPTRFSGAIDRLRILRGRLSPQGGRP